jgi:hypothetical protein
MTWIYLGDHSNLTWFAKSATSPAPHSGVNTWHIPAIPNIIHLISLVSPTFPDTVSSYQSSLNLQLT